jgi:hypothetical protein
MGIQPMRVLLVVALPLLLVARPVLAQSDDMTGVWVRASGFSGNPMSQWSARELPFTPAGRAAFDANIPGKGPRQKMPAFGNDPLGQANPPGLYRTLIYPRPIEIVRLSDRVIQLYEWGKHWRTIWTDGREPDEALVAGPYWYGYSVGEWQGDTLVVTTTGLDGRAWLDEWGTPLTDAAEIEERWRLGAGGKLELTITVTDPELYRESWTSDVKLYESQARDALSGELLEQIFAPIDEVEFNRDIRDRAASGPEGDTR